MQITKSGFTLPETAQISHLQAEFAANHCVVIPQLFENSLVQNITKNIDAGVFYPRQHFGSQDNQEFASDLTMRENELAMHQIHLLLNNSYLFRTIESITGCDKIGSFGGRIYRNLPQVNHHLDWHSDTEEKERLVGISINFSSHAYKGGVFQIRKKDAKTITGEVGCRKLGDAHIFCISPQLQHRVTPTEGQAARTVAAGWFVSKPGIATALKSLFVQSKTQSKNQ